MLADEISEPELWLTSATPAPRLPSFTKRVEFSRAVREIMMLADRANQYIDDRKPWVMAKEEGRDPNCTQSARRGSTCSAC